MLAAAEADLEADGLDRNREQGGQVGDLPFRKAQMWQGIRDPAGLAFAQALALAPAEEGPVGIVLICHRRRLGIGAGFARSAGCDLHTLLWQLPV
jgi:hypothetical protein